MLLKSLFKFFTTLHIGLFRLTGGKFGGSMGGMHVLLLTTTGRKSGKQRTVPLGFFKDESNYVIIASNGGQDKNPAWFFNIQNNPHVTIETDAAHIKVSARAATPEERKPLWDKLMHIAPNYGGYEKRTTREIPLVILQPEG